MATTGGIGQWSDLVDRVRRGGKLSDALTTTKALPPMAVRTLRLGEDLGQLPMLAGRVADFYEAKLQRSMDRMMELSARSPSFLSAQSSAGSSFP